MCHSGLGLFMGQSCVLYLAMRSASRGCQDRAAAARRQPRSRPRSQKSGSLPVAPERRLRAISVP
ncbi:hypothetical protein MBELCI_0876 [Limimaricola cinnabarinus LL-001]|uniref:Uncharacterized protein n=1 Tax=Limimaricola cinnabarinus LL-001 TaxID=1337093 RepID=U3AAZ6_9RHOB|nr:hypothetical protein MBELCI_0876 [Limimaricola cinnabarinus LL-001]